jgi:translation initiation factor IF-2
MSDKTVKELAELVKIPLDRFLEQLKEAGVSASAPDDLVDEDERTKLLAHLRKRHGKDDAEKEESSPKKITLKRRKVSELKQSTAPGVATKTVNVEVRKKKTYIKRNETVQTEEQKEIELARKALEEQKQQIAAEEEERKKHEQSIQATQEENKRKQVLDAELAKKQKQDEALKPVKKETKKEEKKTVEVVETEPAVEEKNEPEVIAEEKVVSDQQEETKAQEPVTEEPQLSEEEQKAKRLAAEKKARLEASIERNAAKVRKQAAAKKQQTLHKKKQAGATAANRNKGTIANKQGATSVPAQKRGIAPGRGAAMPTGNSRKIKGKKGKQKRIQLAAELDAKHQFEKPVEAIVRDVTVPETRSY